MKNFRLAIFVVSLLGALPHSSGVWGRLTRLTISCPPGFVDMHFIKEVDESRFIDNLYKRK